MTSLDLKARYKSVCDKLAVADYHGAMAIYASTAAFLLERTLATMPLTRKSTILAPAGSSVYAVGHKRGEIVNVPTVLRPSRFNVMQQFSRKRPPKEEKFLCVCSQPADFIQYLIDNSPYKLGLVYVSDISYVDTIDDTRIWCDLTLYYNLALERL